MRDRVPHLLNLRWTWQLVFALYELEEVVDDGVAEGGVGEDVGG